MSMQIDYLAITCADLDRGTAWAEAALGVPLQPGGQHAYYGTHNRLLGLGPDMYLEVIAPNPDAPLPGRARWFNLDHADAPVLANWIVRTDDLTRCSADAGEIIALARGDLRWQITVPADGSLCEGGAYPSLIRWGDGAHPAARLTDRGVRLARFEVHHPAASRIAALLPDLDDPKVMFLPGPVSLRAAFETPAGIRWIG
jgi:catechol 2,3-dioxygenase-like lactoylglutathione lyase family enzyme